MLKMFETFMEAALKVAMAPTESDGGGGLVSMLVLMGILVAIWYFLIIGPERKRRRKMQEMVQSLKAGDRVVTVGGIHGTVSGVTEKTIILRISEQGEGLFSFFWSSDSAP